MGGRGAGSGIPQSEGPRAGGSGRGKWGQPNTPQVVKPPNIKGAIGEKGEFISPAEALKNINKYRNVEYGDYSMNCQRCVVAYELNRRGYKVEAEATWERDQYPRGDKWTQAFKGGRLEKVGAGTTKAVNDNITKKMKNWGNGSRGIVKVAYNEKEGHVFNVEYHNGKLHYYDAQTGVKYKNSTVFNHVRKESVSIMRSDNLKINDNIRDMVRKQT